MDTSSTIEFLERETDLQETAQVTVFRGFRTTKDGNMQRVIIEVEDRGEGAGDERYSVWFRSDDGRDGGSGEYLPTVEDAIGVATVHWQELG